MAKRSTTDTKAAPAVDDNRLSALLDTLIDYYEGKFSEGARVPILNKLKAIRDGEEG